MRRPVGVSIQRLQHLPRGAVEGDGIRHGPQAIKIVFPIFSCCEPAPEVHIRLRLILLLVQPVRRRVPHIDHRALDRLSSEEISDSAVHPRAVAFPLLDATVHDAIPHGFLGGVLSVEGTEDGGCGGGVDGGKGEFVGYFVDEGF